MKAFLSLLIILISCQLTFSQDKIKVTSSNKSKSGIGNGIQTRPLIILDGIKLPKQEETTNLDEDLTLEGIDPSDIKQIEVLKDQKAVAKYGEEGKDGVVIITTKDPRKYQKR